jgi:hypothetical protein
MALARIAVSIACGVLGGVLIRSFVPLGIEFVLTTALLSGALCVLAWRARNRTVSVLVLACVTLGVGVACEGLFHRELSVHLTQNTERSSISIDVYI